jgi:hypothetical protein
MAVFGLPGGAEWLFIAAVALFMLVPGALVFWVGYLTGKNAALRGDAPGAGEDGAAGPVKSKVRIAEDDQGAPADEADA